ncbi:hypothetical protein [Longimicrobium terrae]|uniref:Mannan endo-1,4-beta-mannosidase n=1 Tax=Longimicrobium terrae TaxID=1639882 RepID=A0A841GY81_9BACT|nr:hypothetical protein [Longimicrobium terrae]MBB4636329.1 mannan endo-1,4-beta-mannosidase [Longimicrobium terrae]MBB6070725.1 mannan endo-1,4-beta-mannosidase [Longimicrobium terrae]NNC29704.1 hypothetical protein [Longimicrobium terrae]
MSSTIEAPRKRSRRAPEPLAGVEMPWIRVAPDAPYFMDETGAPWTPVGYNDALTWPELGPLYRRKDVDAVDRHLAWLASNGITVLRLMLECAHKGRYLEKPLGTFQPHMVRVWDDLIALCSRHGIRLLLTPYDTFWMWLRFKHHPISRHKGGPCAHQGQVLLCPDTRAAIKNRLTFMVERWGGSGTVFAWDLWNEIHPAQVGDRADCVDVFNEFIHEVSEHVRSLETRLYGRAHPQTVSMFGPELRWRPDLPLADTVFRHPALDFATTHIYMEGSIDHPQDTVACAIDTGRLVRQALREIGDMRPFLDTEHGPIHGFKDWRITLPEAFDDEYFRHMQWAHLASGAAGGGMRWPNRHPHILTVGMRQAQGAMARFLDQMDWTAFRRRNLNEEIELRTAGLTVCASGDDAQALVWLLRTDALAEDGRVRQDAPPIAAGLRVPGLAPGRYSVVMWDTRRGMEAGRTEADAGEDGLSLSDIPVTTDLALAIRRM